MNKILLLCGLVLTLVIFSTKREYMSVVLKCDKNNDMYSCKEISDETIQKENIVKKINNLFSKITNSGYKSYIENQKKHESNMKEFNDNINTLN